MKNIIIVLLLAVAAVTTYVAAVSTFRMKIEGLEGKQATITRGDITLPINATGSIRPYQRVEIKSEASGEVVEIVKQPGDMVKAGELLIRLDPEDEQRSVNRAGLDVDVATAKLEEARISLEQSRTADLETARANVDQIEATLSLSKYRADVVREKPENYTVEERLQRVSTYDNQRAQLDGAKAALAKAELMVTRAEQLVKQAQATFETTQNNLADAKRRLAETDIVSPIYGIVGDINVQEGEVIQGGKTTFTGGTVLGVILDMERMIVQAEVDEADIGRVLRLSPAWALPGHSSDAKMPADVDKALETLERQPTISVESFPDEEFLGVIERIYPEPVSRANVVTYLVDVVIAGENRQRLLPGMRADVGFTSEHAEDVLLCPNEAIKKDPQGKLGVYVPKRGDTPTERAYEFVACEFGLDDGNHSEVRVGLTEGQPVYTKLPAKTDRDEKKKRSEG